MPRIVHGSDGKLKPIRMRHAVLPPSLLERAQDLWSDGNDTKQIAELLGQSEAAVYNGLHKKVKT